MDSSAQLADRLLGIQQRLRRKRAKRHDHFRLNQLNLPNKIGAARVDFRGEWISVARWAVLEDVADIDVLTRELDRGEDLGEQLPGRSHEGTAEFIFRRSRRFTDAHQAGRKAPFSRYRVLRIT
jgi:hypothetical protein